jgi:hypothetical protein
MQKQHDCERGCNVKKILALDLGFVNSFELDEGVYTVFDNA